MATKKKIAKASGQVVGQHDLVLISDSGQFFLIKMNETAGGYEPAGTVEPLQPEFQAIPENMKENGVELADIPDHAAGGGCSCFLLNLARLEGRAVDPQPNATSPTKGGRGGGKKASGMHRRR